MEPSVTVALLGFAGVVVTALCGVAIAFLTNRKEHSDPVGEVVALKAEVTELNREKEALEKMIQLLIGKEIPK